MTAGILFYMVPKLWNTTLYSVKLGNIQFWTGTVGLLLYIVSMWVSGVTQGSMWQAIDPATGTLVYPDFVETVVRIIPMYWVRAIGGTLVLISFLIMIYNLGKTIKNAPKDQPEQVFQAKSIEPSEGGHEKGHRKLEGLPAVFTVLTVLAIIVGTTIEILPSFMANTFVQKNESVKPYTPLELAGRDIYIREGCYNCHSQMIRPLVAERLRYGAPSQAAESVYDHPFQWGSRRIGPDLARVGSKYPNMWHYRHMLDPRAVVPGSIMPSYPWLFQKKSQLEILPKKLQVMQALGVPYSQEDIDTAVANAKEQAEMIAETLAESGVPASIKDKQIIPLIAYLQRLGMDLGTDLKYEEEDKLAEMAAGDDSATDPDSEASGELPAEDAPAEDTEVTQ